MEMVYPCMKLGGLFNGLMDGDAFDLEPLGFVWTNGMNNILWTDYLGWN